MKIFFVRWNFAISPSAGQPVPQSSCLSNFSFECQVIDGGGVGTGRRQLGGARHKQLRDRTHTAWGQGRSSLGTGHKQLRKAARRNPISPASGQIRASLKCGHDFRGPQSLTVAILAQGTHWAVAVTQALFVGSSILGERAQRQRAFMQRDKPQQALAWPM